MKKDCAYARKSLRKYLRGHLFKHEQVKIARHLSVCPLCRSEFLALKKVADTKRLLKDITPPEGLARMKEGVRFLAKLRLLAYRPLLLFSLVGIGVLFYLNVITPYRHDPEIENLEKSIPMSAPVDAVPPAGTQPAPAPAVSSQPTQSFSGSADPNPLLITVAVQNYKDGARLINEALQGHAQQEKMKLSDTVREIDGSMTGPELLELFHRIEKAGKVSYNRKRFASSASGDPILFKIRIKNAPKNTDQQESSAAPASASTSSTR